MKFFRRKVKPIFLDFLSMLSSNAEEMSKVPKINRRTFSKIVGLGVGYAIVLATFFSHPAQAQSAAISKGRAVEIAREKFGGKPFGKIKELENSNGSVTYEVRLDNGGRVLIVHVDEQGNARKQ